MSVRGKLAGHVAVALVATTLTAVLASVVSVAGLTSPPPLTETTAMIRALTAPAFLTAGVLRWGRWYVTGEPECGLRAVALLLMGGICLPSATLARELTGPGEDVATITCVRALSLGAILYVMAVALSDDTADRLRVATLAELTHLEQMLVGISTEVDPYDVADVVRTVTDVRRAAGLRIDVDLWSAPVRCVPADLATALQNLLVNAHDHAPGADVRVGVRTTGDLVQVVVADDGPGIPAVRAGSAFDRGARGPDSDGSGLGLSIARALVRRNGGELELRRTGSGTTFVISLPLAMPSGAAGLASVTAAS